MSTVTVGGDTTEVVEDDNISVVSDDEDYGEVNPYGNVWSRSGVQASGGSRLFRQGCPSINIIPNIHTKNK